MTSPLDRVADIAAWLAATDIECLELVGPGGSLRLRRGGPDEASGLGAPGAATEARTENPETRHAGRDREVVPSPGVGVFLHAHPLRDDPLVRPGDRVAAGQALGLLRIGCLLVPVVAPRSGIVQAVPAADGALVGFGDPLVELSHPR